MTPDAAFIELYHPDGLVHPVAAIPESGGVTIIAGIRLTVAGTAGGKVIDTVKRKLNCAAVGSIEKADWVVLERGAVDWAPPDQKQHAT